MAQQLRRGTNGSSSFDWDRERTTATALVTGARGNLMNRARCISSMQNSHTTVIEVEFQLNVKRKKKKKKCGGFGILCSAFKKNRKPKKTESFFLFFFQRLS